MAFKVRIAPLALADLRSAFEYYKEEASLAIATKWIRGALEAISLLKEMPRRATLAPENDDTDFEVRQIHFKSHRILFTVDGGIRNGKVEVLRIYHDRRRRLDQIDF